MAESLFTSQTPANQNNFDATGINLGTTMVFAVAGTVTKIRFRATTTLSGGTYTGALYQVDTDDSPIETGTGTLLGSATFGALAAGDWNEVTLPAPVAVDTSHAYRAVVFTSVGRYCSTGDFFTTPLTNGNITGIQDTTDPVGVGNLRNGSFRATGALAYPNNTFNEACYFVDVVFEADAGEDIAPDGIAVPVALGDPTLTWSTTVFPTSVDIPAAVGDPTAAWSATAAPDGIGVPVALGAPVVGAQLVAPDGLDIAVALGDPTLVWSATITPDGLAVPVAAGDPTLDGSQQVVPDGLPVAVALGDPTTAWSATITPDGIAVPVTLGAPTVVDASNQPTPARSAVRFGRNRSGLIIR